MGHGHIPVKTLLDHGIITSTCFQIVCSLAHKEDINGEFGEIQFLFCYYSASFEGSS